MARRPRALCVEPGLPHHLVLRGNNRRLLFSYSTDRAQFVKYMAEALTAGQCAVHSAALMSNHVHLVLTPLAFEPLWRCVKTFAQRYALHRNRRREATGKLFEQRYRLEVIRTEAQLAATIAYVDLNPQRAGLTPARGLDWSTYALHCGRAEGHPLGKIWTPSSWWLALGRDAAGRAEAYREFAHRRQEAWASEVVRIAAVPSPRPYTRRLVRPDGTRAADAPSETGPHDRSSALNDFRWLQGRE